MFCREISTYKIDEYRKNLKIVLDGLDSISEVRHSLLGFDTITQLEAAKYNCNNDPEQYYHLKLFDKAVSIIRLYNKCDLIKGDPDMHYMHFSIRIYNYEPKETYKLDCKRYRDFINYGDFLDLNDSLRYFRAFVNELICEVCHIPQNELMPVEIF